MDVAVHDQIAVRVCDRAQHVEEQAHAGIHAELVSIAVFVDGLALDVFENEIGLARRGQPRIDQFGDLRMSEFAENRSLALESLGACLLEQRKMDELDGHPALEPAVAALGQPDRSHAAPADQVQDPIVGDQLAFARPGQRWLFLSCDRAGGHLRGRRFKKISGSPVRSQQRFHFIEQRGISSTGLKEECIASRRINLQRRLQQLIHTFPKFGFHGSH